MPPLKREFHASLPNSRWIMGNTLVQGANLAKCRALCTVWRIAVTGQVFDQVCRFAGIGHRRDHIPWLRSYCLRELKKLMQSIRQVSGRRGESAEAGRQIAPTQARSDYPGCRPVGCPNIAARPDSKSSKRLPPGREKPSCWLDRVFTAIRLTSSNRTEEELAVNCSCKVPLAAPVSFPVKLMVYGCQLVPIVNVESARKKVGRFDSARRSIDCSRPHPWRRT